MYLIQKDKIFNTDLSSFENYQLEKERIKKQRKEQVSQNSQKVSILLSNNISDISDWLNIGKIFNYKSKLGLYEIHSNNQNI